MNRRHSHRYAQPALTRDRDELPRPACEERLDLIEGVYARGKAANYAYPRLMTLCSDCPVREFCWANKEWREALKAVAA